MSSSPSTIPDTGHTSQTSFYPSPSWSLVNDYDLPRLGACDDFPSGDDLDFDMELEEDFASGEVLRERLEELVPQFQTLAVNASQLGPANAISLVEALINPSPEQARVNHSPFFNSSLSVSPVLRWTDATIHQLEWGPSIDALGAVLKAKDNRAQPNSTPCTTQFLLHSLQGCMLQNQNQFSTAKSEFEAAMGQFRTILAHQFEESLSILGNLIALFESYGQRMAARDILIQIAQALNAYAEESPNTGIEPLCQTVLFMCRTQLQEHGKSGTYDMAELKSIRDKL